MKYLFQRVILLVALVSIFAACEDKKKDEPAPTPEERTVNSDTTADISLLLFSQNGSLDFANIKKGSQVTFSISIINNHDKYPIIASLHEYDTAIFTYDASSTCKKNDNILYPRESCNVVFNAVFNEEVSETIDFTDGYNVKSFYLAASPVDTPNITANIGTLNFGEVTTSVEKKIQIKANSEDLANIKIARHDSDPYGVPAFAIPGGTECQAGVSVCDLIVVFAPQQAGSYNAFLDINGSVKIALTGTKKESLGTIEDLLIRADNGTTVLSDNFVLEFGDTRPNQFVARKLTLRNTSNLSAIDYEIVKIPDGFSYSNLSTCGKIGGRLLPSASCDYLFLFEPIKEGISSEVMQLRAGGGLKNITFTGKSGNSQPVTLSTSKIDFGTVSKRSINDNSSVIKYTLINNNLSEPLSINISKPLNFNIMEKGEDPCSTESSIANSCYLRLAFPQKMMIGILDEIIKVTVSKNSAPNEVLATYYISVKINIVDSSYNRDIFIAPRTFENYMVSKIGDYFLFTSHSFEDNITMLYSYKTDEWERVSLPTFPESRVGQTVLAMNSSKLYLFGGVADATQTKLNDLWSFDLSLKRWSSERATNLPAARNKHLLAAFDNKIYLFGGKDLNEKSLSALHSFDSSVGKKNWSVLRTDGNINYSDEMLLIGHKRVLYKLYDKAIEKYYLDSSVVWESVASMPAATVLSDASSVVVNDTAYIFGVLDSSGAKVKDLVTLDLLNISSNTLSTYAATSQIDDYKYGRVATDGKAVYLFYTAAADGSNRLALYPLDADKTMKDIKLKTSLILDETPAPTLSAAVGSDVYFFNGADIWKVDTNDNSYEKIVATGETLTTKASMKIFSVKRQIYIVDSEVNSDYLIFDVDAKTIVKKTATGISFAGNAVADYAYHLKSDKIFVHGGFIAGGTNRHNNLMSCDVDFGTCHAVVAGMSQQTDNSIDVAIYIDNQFLYAYNSEDKVDVVNLETMTKSSTVTLEGTFKRSKYKLFATKGRLYIIGGVDVANVTNVLTSVYADLTVTNTATANVINFDGDAVSFGNMRSSSFVGPLLYNYNHTKKIWGVTTLN